MAEEVVLYVLDQTSGAFCPQPPFCTTHPHILFKMLSFKNIATLATLAFGAMSVLAAPAPLAIELEAEIGTRDVAPTSIPKILDNVIVAVTPIVADLSKLESLRSTRTSD